jgi:hypothetical protein
MVRVLLASALVAAVVVPAVRGHGVAAPTNTSPPTLVISPSVGSTLNVTRGTWSGAPTSFTYEWMFCPGGGGAPDGSDCNVTTKPDTNAYPLLIETADIGYSFRARVTATNASGSTSALSDASAAAIEPDLSFNTGCPPADQAGPVPITKIVPAARLNIDRNTSSPAVITRSTQRLTLRFHVVACGGKNVSGALVYATPTPFQQFAGAERATGADGWATITLTRQHYFPATPQQQNLIVFVRARKSGEDLLGGISTRRLVSFRVRLR